MFNFFRKRPKSSAPPRPSFTVEQIVPRIKHVHFLQAIQGLLEEVKRRGGDPKSQTPVTRPLVGDLIVSYSFDTPESFISVTAQAMQELGLDLEALDKIAVDNLERALAGAVGFQNLLTYQAAATGNNLEACTLLLPFVWDSLAVNFKGEPLVVVPGRSTVYCMDSKFHLKDGEAEITSAQGLGLMCSAAASMKAEETVHGLSEQILLWRSGTWHVAGSFANQASALAF